MTPDTVRIRPPFTPVYGLPLSHPARPASPDHVPGKAPPTSVNANEMAPSRQPSVAGSGPKRHSVAVTSD